MIYNNFRYNKSAAKSQRKLSNAGKRKTSKKPVKFKRKRDPFYSSHEWKKLRYEVLDHYGSTCMCCGYSSSDGVKINVDHIKPRKKYPELELTFSNMQVLCSSCNEGKGNWNKRDWIGKEKIKQETLTLDEEYKRIMSDDSQ